MAVKPGSGGMLASKTRTGAHYRMRSWRASPREALHSAWRYSVFVKVMKGALPITALALGVAVLGYVLQPREGNKVALTFEQLDRVENDLAMLKPQLTGTDDDGRPFKVTAATAVQEGLGSDTIRLEDVIADIGLKDGRTLHITAAKGVADTKNHRLEVSGGIHLTSNDGYDARTASASADLKAGTIQGDTPIEASGKFGSVTALRFALNQATGQFRFTGNVHMVFNPAAQKR
jgi:lipopolysaccharide export system protein LptC